MSIPPGTDTEKSSIGGVPLLNGIAHLDIQLRAAVFEAARRMPERVEAFTR